MKTCGANLSTVALNLSTLSFWMDSSRLHSKQLRKSTPLQGLEGMSITNTTLLMLHTVDQMPQQQFAIVYAKYGVDTIQLLY